MKSSLLNKDSFINPSRVATLKLGTKYSVPQIAFYKGVVCLYLLEFFWIDVFILLIIDNVHVWSIVYSTVDFNWMPMRKLTIRKQLKKCAVVIGFVKITSQILIPMPIKSFVTHAASYGCKSFYMNTMHWSFLSNSRFCPTATCLQNVHLKDWNLTENHIKSHNGFFMSIHYEKPSFYFHFWLVILWLDSTGFLCLGISILYNIWKLW